MVDGRDMRFADKPLVHCPHCTSRLIYVTDTAGYDAEAILHRRCPECEHRDSIVTTAVAAAVWYRRDTRLLNELRELADTLALELAAPVPLIEDAELPGA
jgi:DNA-directed RNA polymerase subunit RPC12/RpoP